jgi:transcription antitermination factor NusG
MSELTPADSRWFAVHVKARHEKAVYDLLSFKQYDGFLPLYRSRRQWADRIKHVDLPVFPGYVFCRFDPKHCLPIVATPGVLRIVGFGDGPLPVDDSEIAAVRRIVTSDLQVEAWPFLSTGMRVRVCCGSLRGTEGTLVSFRGSDRLVVSIGLLQRSCAVEIDRAWIEPCN